MVKYKGVNKAPLLNKLHRYVYLSWIFLLFLLVYPALWYNAKDKERNFTRLVKLRKWIALKGAFFAGFKFKIQEEAPVDWSKNYVICANHSSNLDITALIKVVQNDFSFMGKDDLLKNPVTGLFFKTIDIPVDRTSKISSFRAFKRAQQELKQGRSVGVFPEGGITDDFPPQLMPFKNGAFKLAIEAKVAILPLVIHDAWKLYWDDGVAHGTSPGTCKISVLKPINSAQYADENELREAVHGLFKFNLQSESNSL